MSEMVERVARAIHRAAWNDTGVDWLPGEQDKAKANARYMARNAIEALRLSETDASIIETWNFSWDVSAPETSEAVKDCRKLIADRWALVSEIGDLKEEISRLRAEPPNPA